MFYLNLDIESIVYYDEVSNTFKEEYWLDIPNYVGMYQVSNLGRVKSLSRDMWNGKVWWKSKSLILKAALVHGYATVVLANRMHLKQYPVHQLVAITFLNHLPNGFETVVDHKNNIKIDNRATNLQLVTNRYNSSKDRVGKTSSYTGVSRVKETGKFVSAIKVGKRSITIGVFIDEEEAAKYYNKALLALESGEEIEVVRKEPTTPYKDISFYKPSSKWRLRLRLNGETKQLGLFNTPEEALEYKNNYLKLLEND